MTVHSAPCRFRHPGPSCDSVKGVSDASRPLSMYMMTHQEAFWNWGTSGELGIIFIMDLGGRGLEQRVSVLRADGCSAGLSSPSPAPTLSPPGPVLTCLPGPSGAMAGLPGLSRGWGPAHTGGRLWARFLSVPKTGSRFRLSPRQDRPRDPVTPSPQRA